MNTFTKFLFSLILFILCLCEDEKEYEEFLTTNSNFFHNLIFDIGYGVRKCIENQNLYPYEKIFIDTSDKNYTNDMITGFFVLFSFFIICFFILSLIYDIITSPIYVTLSLRRWYKTIVEEERKKKVIEEKEYLK